MGYISFKEMLSVHCVSCLPPLLVLATQRRNTAGNRCEQRTRPGAEGGARHLDGLGGVLDLEEAPLRAEGVHAPVVLAPRQEHGASGPRPTPPGVVVGCCGRTEPPGGGGAGNGGREVALSPLGALRALSLGCIPPRGTSPASPPSAGPLAWGAWTAVGIHVCHSCHLDRFVL